MITVYRDRRFRELGGLWAIPEDFADDVEVGKILVPDRCLGVLDYRHGNVHGIVYDPIRDAMEGLVRRFYIERFERSVVES
jgi:hypothetical protein